jgi:hypothetical protein
MNQFISNYLVTASLLEKTPDLAKILPMWYMQSVHKVDSLALLLLSKDSKLSSWEQWLMLNSGHGHGPGGHHFKYPEYLLLHMLLNKNVPGPPNEIQNPYPTPNSTPNPNPISTGGGRRKRSKSKSKRNKRNKRRSSKSRKTHH